MINSELYDMKKIATNFDSISIMKSKNFARIREVVISMSYLAVQIDTSLPHKRTFTH